MTTDVQPVSLLHPDCEAKIRAVDAVRVAYSDGLLPLTKDELRTLGSMPT